MKDFLYLLTHYIQVFFTKKNIRFLSLFLVFYFLLGDVSFAVEPNPPGNNDNTIVTILNGILAIAASLLGLITALIGMFLNPGWTNGTLFNLQDYLRIIWILISNVVYFVFAFILIIIAFMNIIGKGEGNWELKQALPRFIVGVLIVPFSWFIVQFILSISGVLTYAVLSLPYDVFKNETLFSEALNNPTYDKTICTSFVLYLTTPVGNNYGGTVALGENLAENFRCETAGSFVKIKDIISGENGQVGLQNSLFGIMSIYTYGILRVQDMDTISITSIADIKDLIDLGLDVVFNILFVVVYLLLMVALLLALFTRGIKLWIFIMMSPIFGLMYFFGKEGMGESTKNYSFIDFVHLAFIPVYVSAALAFGLTFIFVASEGIRTTASNADFEFIEVGGVKLTIKGPHGAGGEMQLNPIGKLIIELFGIAILWIAVITALSKSEHTKNVIKPIADFGTSIGQLAAAAPTYAPIIPTGNGERMGIAGIGTMGEAFKSGIANNSTRAGSTFGSNIADAITRNTNAFRRAMNTVTATDMGNGTNSSLIRSENNRIIGAIGNLQDRLNNSSEREALFSSLEHIYGEDVGKKLKEGNPTTPQQFGRIMSEISRNKPAGMTPQQYDVFRDIHQGGIEGIINIYKSVDTPQDSPTRGSAGPTNITLNINGKKVTNTTEAANIYLADRTQFGDSASVKAHLDTEAVKNNNLTPPIINAIVQAFEEGLNDN